MTTPWYKDPLDPSVGEVPEGATEQVAAQVRDTLWNGKRIHGYAIQYRYWALIVGLIGASAVAGWYFGLWQVHWRIYLGPVRWKGFWLKPWWDAGTWWPRWLGHWPLYRHIAFRDQLEPGIGCLLALSVMAKQKWWGVRVGVVSIGVRIVLVLALTVGLGTLGVWLDYFGLPWLWGHAASAAGHPGYNLDRQFTWAGHLSLFILVWGIGVMGPVLHRVWAPAGATINGSMLDRSADRHRDRAAADNREHIPAWVRLPISAPNLRYRWSGLYLLPDDGRTLAEGGLLKRTLITLGVAGFAWLVILGIIGHYLKGVGGMSIPYLAP
jgi:hypothetical protein